MNYFEMIGNKINEMYTKLTMFIKYYRKMATKQKIDLENSMTFQMFIRCILEYYYSTKLVEK